MKTLDQFKSELEVEMQKKLASHAIECAIAECLPIPPKYIHVYPLYSSIGSVSYQCKTPLEAYKIWQAFENKQKAWITRERSGAGIRPYESETAESTVQCIAWLDISQHGAKLHFYIDCTPGVVRVDIELSLYQFGTYAKSDRTKRENFTMEWRPFPLTNEMHCAIAYGRVYSRGAQSGKQYIYAIYEAFEIENQFNRGE